MISETDIQIGDWLHFEYTNPIDGFVSFNFKVSQLRRDYGDELLVWGEKTPDGKHFGNIGIVSRIQPIPLTIEILEKNFPEPTDGITWYPEDGGFNCHTYIPKCEINAFGLFKYVHQLQHALRLCEIKKEIII